VSGYIKFCELPAQLENTASWPVQFAEPGKNMAILQKRQAQNPLDFFHMASPFGLLLD
jgi:hypothetical protein